MNGESLWFKQIKYIEVSWEKKRYGLVWFGFFGCMFCYSRLFLYISGARILGLISMLGAKCRFDHSQCTIRKGKYVYHDISKIYVRQKKHSASARKMQFFFCFVVVFVVVVSPNGQWLANGFNIFFFLLFIFDQIVYGAIDPYNYQQ